MNDKLPFLKGRAFLQNNVRKEGPSEFCMPGWGYGPPFSSLHNNNNNNNNNNKSLVLVSCKETSQLLEGEKKSVEKNKFMIRDSFRGH